MFSFQLYHLGLILLSAVDNAIKIMTSTIDRSCTLSLYGAIAHNTPLHSYIIAKAFDSDKQRNLSSNALFKHGSFNLCSVGNSKDYLPIKFK